MGESSHPEGFLLQDKEPLQQVPEWANVTARKTGSRMGPILGTAGLCRPLWFVFGLEHPGGSVNLGFQQEILNGK